jgi:hypothetical protein
VRLDHLLSGAEPQALAIARAIGYRRLLDNVKVICVTTVTVGLLSLSFIQNKPVKTAGLYDYIRANLLG